MTNFIFKSASDLQKIRQQLLLVLAEQRHQRSDLKLIQVSIDKLITDSKLQKQVDDYMDEHDAAPEEPSRDLDWLSPKEKRIDLALKRILSAPSLVSLIQQLDMIWAKGCPNTADIMRESPHSFQKT